MRCRSYASGLYSSRRIARACRERNDFVMIVALDPPDFRTISDFRKRHLKALGELFLQVLKLCEMAGLVKLGHVALDGAARNAAISSLAPTATPRGERLHTVSAHISNGHWQARVVHLSMQVAACFVRGCAE